MASVLGSIWRALFGSSKRGALLSRRFTRTREDFRCSNCDAYVAGNGYTNHCPTCLWSRHVDVFPGDRSASCGAPMRPVALEYERNEFVVVHVCTECGERRRCRSSPEDDVSALL